MFVTDWRDRDSKAGPLKPSIPREHDDAARNRLCDQVAFPVDWCREQFPALGATSMASRPFISTARPAARCRGA